MATYYIDSAAAGTNDGSSWTNAWTSIIEMLADGVGTVGTPLAAGDIVYVASNSVDAATYSAATTVYGPTVYSSDPAVFISATSGTTTYAAASTNQIDSYQSGTYAHALTFDGHITFEGIRIQSGGNLSFSPDSDEQQYLRNCWLGLGPNGTLYLSGSYGAVCMWGGTIDCAADGTTPRSGTIVVPTARVEIIDVDFTNCGYRTGVIFLAASLANLYVSGCDLSSANNGTTCELVTEGAHAVIANCKTAAAVTNATAFFASGMIRSSADVLITGCGTGDSPTQLIHATSAWNRTQSSSVYRTGGAEVGGTAFSWQIDVQNISKFNPLYTPWIYGTISSTGTKSFTVHVAHTASLTDVDAWLEVEVKADSSSGKWSRYTTFPGPTATGTALTTDSGSTWSNSPTYKQSITLGSVPVNTTGLYRARLVVGNATADGMYFDPQVTVA